MKCSSCGNEIPDKSLFCLHCGARIAEESTKPENSPKYAEDSSPQNPGKKLAGNNRGKILLSVLAVLLVLMVIGMSRKAGRYNQAMEDMEAGNYLSAMEAFTELEDYKDSREAALECSYQYALQLLEQGSLDEAKAYFEKVNTEKDVEEELLECDYRRAEMLRDSGNYSEAEQLFQVLEEYKDSADKVFACRYLQAQELLKQEDYEAALNLFLRTSGYQDSETCIHECQYQLGQIQLAQQDYLGAYEYFQYIPGNYKDTEGIVARCLYQIARDYYDAGSYESAIGYAESLRYYSLPSQYDTKFIKDLQLRYAELLINRKDNASLEEALYFLGELDSNQQIRNLIKKAETQQKQNIYDAGLDYLNKKQYTNAIREFEKIKNFSDAKKQWLEAMYCYVQNNKSRYDDENAFSTLLNLLGDTKTFHSYAKTLSENNYKDSRAYYKELTAWHMEVTMNNFEQSEVDLNSISKYDSVYAHLKLSGGPLDGETRIRYVFTLPSGSSTSGWFSWTWKEGDSSCCWCYYNDPYKGPPGTCFVKIYDDKGNLIGKDQIRLTY